MNKKLIYSTALGALLGVFCIIGASIRMPGELSSLYLLSFWYNRVMIGFVIGLLPSMKSLKFALIRGLVVGLFVSFAFYSATNLLDPMGFVAGIVYGVIIELVLFKLKQYNKL